jgi:hypothetical protein
MCCFLVSGFLTEITQQIHSLRASGVISSHFARAARSEMRTFRKSAGKLCTAPAEIAFLVMDFIYIVTQSAGQSQDAVQIGPQGRANLDNRAHHYCPAASLGLAWRPTSAIPRSSRRTRPLRAWALVSCWRAYREPDRVGYHSGTGYLLIENREAEPCGEAENCG